jgi:hypothetical protein
MTETDDRIVVSRKALEMALQINKQGLYGNSGAYLREIIDTAEEAEAGKECVWTLEDHGWATSCGGYRWVETMRASCKHCPHCGGRIVAVSRACGG